MLWRERFTYRDASGRRRLRPFARAGLLLLLAVGAMLAVAASARVYMLTRPLPHPKLPAAARPLTFPTPAATAPTPPTVVLTPPRRVTTTLMQAVADGWAVGPGGIYHRVGERWHQVDVGISPLTVSASLKQGNRLWIAYTTMSAHVDVQAKTIFYIPGEEIRMGLIILDPRTGNVLERRPLSHQPWDLALWRGDVYANTNDGVYRLPDEQKIGPPKEAPYYLGFSLLATADALYAGMWDGVWRWDGTTWTHVLPLQKRKVVDMAQGGGYLYAGTSDGVYRSRDGTTWQRVLRTRTPALVVLGDRLYAGGDEVVVWDTVRQQTVVRYNLYALGLSVDDEGRVWVMAPEGTYVLNEHP